MALTDDFVAGFSSWECVAYTDVLWSRELSSSVISASGVGRTGTLHTVFMDGHCPVVRCDSKMHRRREGTCCDCREVLSRL